MKTFYPAALLALTAATTAVACTRAVDGSTSESTATVTDEDTATDLTYVYGGCYTTEKSWLENNPGEGIQTFTVDASTGQVTAFGDPYTDIIDPTWLTTSSNGLYLYAGSEAGTPEDTAPQAFTITDGALTFLEPLDPDFVTDAAITGITHTSLFLDDTVLLAAHYGGFVSAFEVDSTTGQFVSVLQSIEFTDVEAVVDSDRQDASHPHAIVPRGNFIYVPDLGGDIIRQFSWDADTNTMIENVEAASAAVPAGSGPRHLVFHPTLPVAYVVYELTSEVGIFSVDDTTGVLTELQDALSSLPADVEADGQTAAAIHVHSSGEYVLVSNRGEHTSIGVYSVDADTGELTTLGDTATTGSVIRDFVILPNDQVVVAFESSDEVEAFSFDAADGSLTPYADITPATFGTANALAF